MSEWLPLFFLGLMGVAVLVYAILDGYDLGVGMSLPMDRQQKDQRDILIASIGPFWDANETWLVLAIGVLLIAFPGAHSVILKALYLPAAIMLAGLILRGVAFDFRAKAMAQFQYGWDWLFKIGSWVAALSQGYMLGHYVMGFQHSFAAYLFCVLSAVCVAAAYWYIGSAWLVLKTEGQVQINAARLGRYAGWFTALGVAAISVVNPLINPSVADRWFQLPEVILLLPIPMMCVLLLLLVDRYLARVPVKDDAGHWVPFLGAASLFVLCILGFAYSYFPHVIPNGMTAHEAASATNSLQFVFYGVVIVLPMIALYTGFSYWVFRGKTKDLTYY